MFSSNRPWIQRNWYFNPFTTQLNYPNEFVSLSCVRVRVCYGKNRYNWTNSRYDELHKILFIQNITANSSNVDLFMGFSQNDCTLADKHHVIITTNENECRTGMNRAFQSVFLYLNWHCLRSLVHTIKCACTTPPPILFIAKWQNYFLIEFNLLLEFISHIFHSCRVHPASLARAFSCGSNLFHCINGCNTIHTAL